MEARGRVDAPVAHGVVAAPAADFPRLGACLAAAFVDDPVSTFLFPEPRTRQARLSALYRMVLGAMASHGHVAMDPSRRGAAVWQAPSPPVPGVLAEGIGAFVMFAVLRTASLRGLALSRAAASVHPSEPHWYLGILGTDPAHQGQGVASLLLRPVLSRCDETGVLAYLESSKESNIPFYERHGFRVTGNVRVDGGPVLWPMQRAPDPSRAVARG